MTLCPICNKPGGIALFTSVASCEACANSVSPAIDLRQMIKLIDFSVAKFTSPHTYPVDATDWENLPGFLRWEALSATDRYQAVDRAAVFSSFQPIIVPREADFCSVGDKTYRPKLADMTSCWLTTGAINPSMGMPTAHKIRYYWTSNDGLFKK